MPSSPRVGGQLGRHIVSLDQVECILMVHSCIAGMSDRGYAWCLLPRSTVSLALFVADDVCPR